MLGSSKLTALLGSAPDATADNTALKSYAKALQAAGLHLFLVTPGGKTPAECRPKATLNKEIQAAADAGLPKPTGLHMATDSPTKIGRWIDKYRKDREENTPVNMALEVGRSRLLVVDVDTPAELNAFRQTWAQMSGDPNLAWVSPTVSSPGVQEADGSWTHQGGGHFYFTLPDGVDLSRDDAVPSTVTYGDDGAQWVVRIKDAYVLIPPSVRKEGAYWVSGTDHKAPDWLLEDLGGRVQARAERKAARAARAATAQNTGDVDSIQAWGMLHPWSELLGRANWTPAGRVDNCTCEIWTRPGNNPTPKSATAHSSGCSDERFDPLNPPIHIWSDNVEGGLADWVATHGKTLSKLQFVAAVFHGGDIGKAMEAEGITAEHEDMTHGTAVSGAELAGQVADVVSRDNLAAQMMEDDRPVTLSPAGVFADPAGLTEETSSEDAEPSETPSSESADAPRRPVLASFNHWRNLPPPEYIVDGWVEDLALSAIIGPSGVGKSAVVLDMACSIAMGVPWQGKTTKRSKVLYIAGEGGTGAAQRVKAWEAEHGLDVGEDLFMITEAVLIGSSRDLWDWLAEQIRANGIRLVVFDTLARMSLGLEENSASDMGNAVARFDRLRREADTGVMVIHHTARGQSHGRGSTAILGALDSEVLVQNPDEDDEEGESPVKRLTATVTKQKNAADGEELALTLCQRHGSIVVADAYGQTGDPFARPAADVVEFARPTPESDTELAIRLAEYLAPLPMQGATLTDMVRDVLPSRAYRKDPPAWKAAVLRAKDRGLATGLVNTFGPDGSQRFVRGSATPDQARALDRAEAQDRGVGT
ncbi:DNA primase/helicase [Gordonia phage Upyo]|nr:DNA primase/helicase [Gordonia phage Upyo]